MAVKSAPELDARPLVDRLLADAVQRRASDIHLEPTAGGYEVRLRVDGLLETIAIHDPALGRGLVTRLMVMARLLTYRLDIPQEGRLSALIAPIGAIDLRLAIMPTTHGLRAVVRLPAELIQPRTLEELGLPPSVLEGLFRFARADAGMLILTGPAGSGKTTTIYALLQFIALNSRGLSIIALEDPVERNLPGITQIEVSPFGQLTYETAFRSILRQDPQVLMLGEIRDPATASLAVQAALSGHRLITTFHASEPAGALSRLLEMGLEPYQVASAVFGVVAQRLLRRRHGDEYRGRVPVAEFVTTDESLRQAILARGSASEMRKSFMIQNGYSTMRSAAGRLVTQGTTDAAEVQRVFGDEE